MNDTKGQYHYRVQIKEGELTGYDGIKPVRSEAVQHSVHCHHDETATKRHAGSAPQVLPRHSHACHVQHQSLIKSSKLTKL